MKADGRIQEAFAVIGKETSTAKDSGFIHRLRGETNARFDEFAGE